MSKNVGFFIYAIGVYLFLFESYSAPAFSASPAYIKRECAKVTFAMDSLERTGELSCTSKVPLEKALLIAVNEEAKRVRNPSFFGVFSRDGRYYFFLLQFDRDKRLGFKPVLPEVGVYVDSETGQARYIENRNSTFLRPAGHSAMLDHQLKLLVKKYPKYWRSSFRERYSFREN